VVVVVVVVVAIVAVVAVVAIAGATVVAKAAASRSRGVVVAEVAWRAVWRWRWLRPSRGA
jgi:hypothetical protein